PEDGREDAASAEIRRRRRRDEFPGKPRPSVDRDVAQDDRDHRENEEAREPRQAREERRDDLDPARHQPLNFFLSLPTYQWPARLSRNVMTKRKAPMKKRTW